MPQVFPKRMNPISRIMLLSIPLIASTTGVALAAFFRSDYTTGRNEIVDQPIPFSHLHHVSELGIDCRYCHTSVESSAYAGVPPTKTCMNCHQQVWNGADILEPLRKSYQTETPIAWTKVHNTPNYTYFNHSIHVGKGVGCVSCHERIDQMPLVRQSKTLLMEWCLDCHRHPEKNLRPKSEVFNLAWRPDDGTVDVDGRAYGPTHGTGTQSELGRELKEKYLVRDEKTLTNCSICHR
ncbi:cytochrome c3 family protein [Limnoglobus roseus]|uniref:Cytochrome C n=1 Tax=Limnoglobus roseus TaxID=2598579 RepID=A0A5C1AC31_9BACT|nr:cytochrome c3 family protein [Limnoglobus roseus]QEL15362.1 cytochrome C [Limnoglobus roseus]